MALTMTRTRTQTALTKLAQMVANLHGELEFIAWAVQLADEGQYPILQAKRAALLRQRDALYTTLRVFDPQLDPTSIGSSDAWMKPFGRRRTAQTIARYSKPEGTPGAGSGIS